MFNYSIIPTRCGTRNNFPCNDSIPEPNVSVTQTPTRHATPHNRYSITCPPYYPVRHRATDTVLPSTSQGNRPQGSDFPFIS